MGMIESKSDSDDFITATGGVLPVVYSMHMPKVIELIQTLRDHGEDCQLIRTHLLDLQQGNYHIENLAFITHRCQTNDMFRAAFMALVYVKMLQDEGAIMHQPISTEAVWFAYEAIGDPHVIKYSYPTTDARVRGYLPFMLWVLLCPALYTILYILDNK